VDVTRHKNATLFEVLVDIFATIPAWVCLPAALITYLVVALSVAHLANGNQLLSGFAPLAHTLGLGAAAFVLFAGLFGVVFKISRQRLYNAQTGVESIRKLHWRDFERLIGEAFRRQGYEVAEIGGKGADGGIDLKLYRSGQTVLVQCKQWKAYRVGVQPVRELFGVLISERANRAVLVTSGSFTQEARAFASGKPLELIDGHALIGLMDLSKSTVSESGQSTPSPPTCPLCGQPMLIRIARKGANAGGQFWGCSTYPKCKGIRQVTA
jgi:restriction system protein